MGAIIGLRCDFCGRVSDLAALDPLDPTLDISVVVAKGLVACVVPNTWALSDDAALAGCPQCAVNAEAAGLARNPDAAEVVLTRKVPRG